MPEPPQDNSEMQVSGSSPPTPRVDPAPNFPTLSIRLPPPATSFDEGRAPSQAPVAGHGTYDHLSNDQIHEQCKTRGHSQKDLRAALNMRSASMDAGGSKRASTGDHALDASVRISGEPERPPAGMVGYLNGPHPSQEEPCCVDALRLASFPDKGVVKWSFDLVSRLEATQSAAVEGVDCAISARVAGERTRLSGQELTEVEEILHADLVRDAQAKRVSARTQFKVLKPLQEGSISKAEVNTRWVLTWKPRMARHV